MMNEKCAACIHCEVCGLIESEVAKGGACDFYEDGKRKFIVKSDGTIEQIKNCDDCIFRKEWEKIGELLSVILKKQTEQEPCGDAISRQAVLEQINCWIGSGEYRYTNATYYLTRRMQDLPPVTPQPKTGHWEWVQYDYNPKLGDWHCSECRSIVIECVDKNDKGGIPLYKYCPQCGAKMVEPQESEDKE